MIDKTKNPIEIQVAKAEFIKGAVDKAGYPESGAPEIAFAGRSNVGKSSLINCLLNRRKLVKTSSVPGKTQMLNFFNINDRFHFVDLPGYGYAKVPKSIRKKWKPMVESYLDTRETLLGVVLLVDVRRLPSEGDIALADFLEQLNLPYVLVLTKADKLKPTELKKQLSKMKNHYGQGAEFLLFSSKTRAGREKLWDVLLKWLGLDKP